MPPDAPKHSVQEYEYEGPVDPRVTAVIQQFEALYTSGKYVEAIRTLLSFRSKPEHNNIPGRILTVFALTSLMRKNNQSLQKAG